jgi:phage-related protein
MVMLNMPNSAYVRMPPKPRKDLEFVGSSYDDLIAFPPDARHEAGYQLDRIQQGEEPKD